MDFRNRRFNKKQSFGIMAMGTLLFSVGAVCAIWTWYYPYQGYAFLFPGAVIGGLLMGLTAYNLWAKNTG